MSDQSTDQGQTGLNDGWFSQPQQQHFSDVAPDTEQSNSSEPDASPSEAQADDGLANGFLKNVPEAHRPVVAPYVKQWDAGVQRKFADLHNELNPYKELGLPVENLGQAAQIYRMLEENPQQIYELLKEEFGQEGANEVVEEAVNSQEDQGFQLPPELKQQMDLQQQVLEAMAQKFLDQETSAKTEAEDKAIDDYLGNLKTEFGDFDEDYVIGKMLKGMDGEKAVKAYQEALQKHMNDQSKPAPRVLNGGGPVPNNNLKVSEVPRNDIKAFVAEQLRLANQQGR